ncbi:MAG: ABC transporter permease [Faecalicatena sp.]|uniref:ABC transporter permease n=1 Tax=Faecalicatena sp. TaxID=2005360 RepID=UPI0025855EE6|nr:ABC transporter permease [Faecalicatena sp.]MCI6465591.1 ABC transporter permease [Faecalicatena sp.]MDY5617423.1 ABC transporter permease [Lachnospiraceae bacterium]
MLNKLALRNAKRSFRDYFIYLMTMILITSLMFAFNSMLFSKDIQQVCTEAGMLAAMIGLATFFIVLIIIWLVHYMMKFMAEKRGREFATYLLLGFHKKQIARLFFKETVLLGTAAFLIGLIPGIFLQQVMITLIYAIVDAKYQIHLDVKPQTLLMTAAIFCAAYLLALFRNNRRFRKMNIRDMMYLEQQNEELKNGNKTGRQWLFIVSLLFMIFFGWMMVGGHMTDTNIYPLIAMLIASVYLLYIGLSAYLVNYIHKGRPGVWKEANVFVLRQLSSKVRTMQFTLGTLTLLFMIALLGSSHAFMLNQFQSTQSDEKWPFDVAIYKEDPNYDFSKEVELLKDRTKLESEYAYQIYENKTDDFSKYMEFYFSDILGNSVAGSDAYFNYDPYMKLTDYNHLREMLGYKKVALERDQYLIHIKGRLEAAADGFSKKSLELNGEAFQCAGVQTEGFEQNGHNGADYLLIVPDEAAASMEPYYALLMAQVKGSVSKSLERELKKETNDIHTIEEMSFDSYSENVDRGYGTDIMYVKQSDVFIRDTETKEMKSLLSVLIFPLFYIGLVFLCVALTVLAVQQLSDSNKYKYRYALLKKLGLKEKELNKTILKQLFLYYICPFVVAVLISGGLVLYDSNQFTKFSDVNAPSWSYFGLSLLLFGGIYLIYFVATYVEFKRNLKSE